MTVSAQVEEEGGTTFVGNDGVSYTIVGFYTGRFEDPRTMYTTCVHRNAEEFGYAHWVEFQKWSHWDGPTWAQTDTLGTLTLLDIVHDAFKRGDQVESAE